MRFEFHPVASLPPLAWCARVDRHADVIAVFHGALVETRATGFIEGAWNGTFDAFDFSAATIIVGTGAWIAGDEVCFTTSTDCLSPLFSIVMDASVFVSNSPTFVLAATGERPDDLYPFYGYDMVRIFRQGQYCPCGHLKLASERRLRLHYVTVMTVDRQGDCRFDGHQSDVAPHDYRSYREQLVAGVQHVATNARHAARKCRYELLASLSRGYDSTATAALAKAAGCTEAYTFIDERSKTPHADSGAANGQAMGLACREYSRWAYLELAAPQEAEHAYVAVSTRLPLVAVAAAGQLEGRMMIVGDIGDALWDPAVAGSMVRLARPWGRRTHGITGIEFRLRTNHLVMAPSYIGAQHGVALAQIARADEMRAWSVGGDYDRPIARRLGEEAGAPRNGFGVLKTGGTHSHLVNRANFTPRALARYVQFVRERHALAPAHDYQLARSRVARMHRRWATTGSEAKRYVPSDEHQRRFPFSSNSIPTPVPWDYMFTLQWAVATLRERYESVVRKD